MEKKEVVQEAKVYDVSEVFEIFGKYQVIQFVLLCFPAIFITMINNNYIFIVGDLNYRCRIPECDSPNATYEVAWWPNASIDRCSKPLLTTDHVPGSGCTNESFSGVLDTCNEWVYETNNTVVAELNLACRPWLSNLVGSVHSAGMGVSIIVGGLMSDRFGRKPTLIFCAVSSWIGQLKTIATSYFFYVTIEFFEAAVTGASYSAAMMLMLEICNKKNRMMAGVIFAYATYMGECLFAILGMFVPYWKNLIHIINGPAILFISYIFLLRESLRWQIINGKTEKAKETLLKVADINNINIDRQQLAELDEVALKNKFDIRANEKREGLKQIAKSKEVLKRLVVVAVCRFTVAFVYSGMMINSVFLPGNKYTNFLISTVMSFPGELLSLYSMNKIGRKMPLLFGFLISGILCVIQGCVPATFTWTKIILYMFGKMFVSMCFTGAITYSMELFPTSARGTLLGFVAVASRVGGILAPLTPIMNSKSEALPLISFGCTALLAGILLTLTPETKDLPLMDTIRQVEESVSAAKEKQLLKKQRRLNPTIDVDDPLISKLPEAKGV